MGNEEIRRLFNEWRTQRERNPAEEWPWQEMVEANALAHWTDADDDAFIVWAWEHS